MDFADDLQLRVLGLQPRDLSLLVNDLPGKRVGLLGPGAALLRRQPLQLAALTSMPPRHQVRRVQALAPKQSADLTGPVQASASCRTFLLYSAVKRRLLALDVTSVGERGGKERWFDDVVTSSRLLALYTKLRTGSCLTHVGREGTARPFTRRP